MAQSGIVRWFNEKKGYGFVESQGVDYFLHFSELKGAGFKTVAEGANVEFIPRKGPKGMEASEVVVVV